MTPDEIEDRCAFLRDEIRRCYKAIDSGKADPWWHEDKSRFEQELRELYSKADEPRRIAGNLGDSW